MVNLELYRVFYTVAKCGSLTKAADELFISQPAVSQAIKQLETQLGTTLFNRTHRGMELSLQGGKLIFKQVEEALKLLDDAEQKLTELQTTATGIIRIGATDAIFSNVLADKIVKYNVKYPGVKIDLITGTTPETLEQLKTNKCDIAFVNMPVEDKDVNLTGTVAHLTDVFVAGRKYDSLFNLSMALLAWLWAKSVRKEFLLKKQIMLNSLVTLLLIGIISLVVTNGAALSLSLIVFVWLGIVNLLPICIQYAIYSFISKRTNSKKERPI